MISRRLSAARSRLGWSREALAYHSGVSWSAIAQLESGRRTSPRPETLVSLAGALGVSVGYLVGEHPPRTLLSHRALVYGGPDAFVEAVAHFVREGVRLSEPVLVVSTAQNLGSVERHLDGWPEGVSSALSDAWYGSPLTAITAIRSFSDDQIRAGASWIRVVGEPIWMPPNVALWATYESMFNLIFAAAPLTVLCPYDSTSLDPAVVRVAQRTHPALVRATDTVPNDDFVDPEVYVLGPSDLGG
jgi:transcriptional regulator with XRE-family HTH domain